MTTFLDRSAYYDEGFPHPGGQAATRVLVDYLDLKPGDNVLDIGCGTGATAALIAGTHRPCLVAIDYSSVMLSVASKRIHQSRLSESVHLVQADANRGLPLMGSVFDAAYAESVVALLEPDTVLRECRRVLRLGGKLMLNERIWKPGVTQGLADDINAVSRHAFGIPAATSSPLDRDGWEWLLRRSGFTNVRATPTWEVASKHTTSSLQSRIVRYRHHLRRPDFIPQTIRYKFMIRRYAPYWTMLENYLFFAQKPE